MADRSAEHRLDLPSDRAPGAARRAGPGDAQLTSLADGLNAAPPVQRLAAIAPRANRTGLPDPLKNGIERLSGLSMDHVRVHYNSPRPAQMRAHAYAQGSDIHVAPGQAQHLPHEAWHVVQQAQGRVQATRQMQSIGVNDDPALEREATEMGARALSTGGMAGPDAAPMPVQQRQQDDGVAQLWPPASIEDAERRIREIEAMVLGHHIRLGYSYGGKLRAFALDEIDKKTLPDTLKNAELEAEPGDTGLASPAILVLLHELADLRGWVNRARMQERGFGFGAIPTTHFQPPSPFQTTYGFNPMAPELHQKPIGYAPPGSTFEMLGDDMVLRGKSSEALDEMRSNSSAYRIPTTKLKTQKEPPFDSSIYDGRSTILTPERIREWKQQSRSDEKAKIGPFKGSKWPDQKAVMGRMSAQEAVASYNESMGRPVLDLTTGYEWLHLFAFSMGGVDALNPQDPQNLVVGTQQANLYHLIFETAAKLIASMGYPVAIRANAVDAISEDWRIYRYIVYTISLLKVQQATWTTPEQVYAARTLVRRIPCLERPQVHASDAETLADTLLAELGIITDRYREAVERIFPRSDKVAETSNWQPGGRSSQIEEEEDAMEVGYGDDLHTALVGSVQDIARHYHVLEDFVVGHADGSDDNCAILSVFEAAGDRIDRATAARYRAWLVDNHDANADGPLDLADPEIATGVQALLAAETGTAHTIRVIHPQGDGYALTDVAEGGSPIFLFYASGHFSPAWPR